jgi:copper chaperone CopZ
MVLIGAHCADAGVSTDAETVTFQVEGMHCDGCSAAIVGTLERIEGVLSATADHEEGVAQAEFRPNEVTAEELKRAIEDLGYAVVSMDTAPSNELKT